MDKIKVKPKFTRHPVLKDGQSILYSGCGCTWDIDFFGRPFHLIEQHSDLPANEEDRVAYLVDKRLEELGIIEVEDELTERQLLELEIKKLGTDIDVSNQRFIELNKRLEKLNNG